MNAIVSIALIVLAIALIVAVPAISIWALNTLFVGVIFKSAIELNLMTYLAMFWFGGMLGLGVGAAGNRK